MGDGNVIQRAKAFLGGVLEDKSFRGVALIGGGTALGQALTVLATPIISRLYGPQAYGALAVFGSFLSIASILVTFRFEICIPLPKDDEEARDLLVLSLALTVLSALLVGLGLSAWLLLSPDAARSPLFRHLAWTLPLGMLGIGCYQTLAYWSTRKRIYGAISATRISQAVAALATQFALFKLPPAGLGLILSSIVGQAFGLRPLFLAFRSSGPQAPLPSPGMLLLLGRKYFNFSAYGIATAVTTTIGSSLPALLLAKAYSLEVAGIYLMASRVLSIPTRMIGGAVSQVFMGEASQRLRDDPGSVLGYFHSTHRILLWVGAGVLLLGALSPLALPWILGGKWQAAGTVAALLAPMAAMELTVNPLYNIAVIGNRPNLQLLTGILPLGLSILGLGLPILLRLSYTKALLGYVFCACLSYWLIYMIYRNIARVIGSAPSAGSAGDPCLPS